MSREEKLKKLKEAVKSFPDFPKKGVVFRDFFPILQSPQLLDDMLTLFEDLIKAKNVQLIVGLESRGFLLGPALALRLKLPFIPIRKPGKLPGNVKKESYTLEYGVDALEIQTESMCEGRNRAAIVDDLLATGGTMAAAVKLIQEIGGSVECCLLVMELNELNGRSRISVPVYSLMEF